MIIDMESFAKFVKIQKTVGNLVPKRAADGCAVLFFYAMLINIKYSISVQLSYLFRRFFLCLHNQRTWAQVHVIFKALRDEASPCWLISG